MTIKPSTGNHYNLISLRSNFSVWLKTAKKKKTKIHEELRAQLMD